MAYIGQRPVIGRYIKLDQISSGFNGSNTGFSMTAGSQAVFPGTARNLLLSLGGVIQEPDTDFTISGSTLTFTTAPVANTTFFGVIYGDMQATGTPSDGTVLPASIASSGNFSFPEVTVTGDVTISNELPTIALTDTGTNPDYELRNENGEFRVRDTTSGVNRMRITSGGTVDVAGNLDVGAGIDVTGSVNATTDITLASTTAGQSFIVTKDGTQAAKLGHIGTGNEGLLVLKDGGTDTVVLNGETGSGNSYINSTNFGIGTATPSDKLHVYHASENSVARFESGDTGAFISLKDDTHTSQVGSTNGAFEINVDNGGDITGESINFKMSGSSKVFIDSSGRLLIGDTSSASSTAMLQTKRANNNTILISNSDATATNFTAVDFAPANSTVGSRIVSKAIGTFGSSAAQTADLFFETIHQGTSEKRLYIDSTGLVGINQDTPTCQLQVDAGSSGSGTSTALELNHKGNDLNDAIKLNFARAGGDIGSIVLEKVNNNNTTDFIFNTRLSNTVDESMRISGAGNVGIGTISPRSITGYKGLTLNHATHGGFIQFQDDGTNTSHVLGGPNSLDVSTQTSIPIYLKTAGDNIAMTIDTSQKVGIGTTSPGYKLDVKNNSTTAYSSSASPSNVIARIQNGSAQDDSHASFLLTAMNDNSAMDFWWMTCVSQSQNYNGALTFTARTTSSSSQELVRFANNGRVSMQVLALGSGNSHASAKLVIQGTGNTSGTNTVYIKNSDETPLLVLRNDGVFYTGTDGASPYNLTTSSNANVVVTSDGVLRRSTSSVRYKKDIADATFGLADVLKLKPKTFKNNATGEFADDKTYAGFTAEDIHDLGLTEFVQYNEDNEPDALAYGNMVALMAKAIQELNAKVAALEAA